jgi:hypothetical protein
VTVKLAATLLVLAVLAALTPVASAATPSAKADPARAVCLASADAKSNIDDIRADVIAPGTPLDVRASLALIQGDIATIRTALPGLPPAARRPVAAATVAFVVRLRRLVPGLLAAPAGEAAPARLALFTGAVARLPVVWATTLGRLPC